MRLKMMNEIDLSSNSKPLDQNDFVDIVLNEEEINRNVDHEHKAVANDSKCNDANDSNEKSACN